jgi:tetratricopeptide (TPR) repeat protein
MKLKNTIFLLIFSTFSLVAQVNTQRLLDIGRNAMYFEDYVVAIQNFNQVINAKPYLTEPYLYRAFAKLNLEDYYGAISDCNAALEINPFLPKVYFCRGYAYRLLGDIGKSTLDFKKSLEFDPNNINTCSLVIENLIR